MSERPALQWKKIGKSVEISFHFNFQAVNFLKLRIRTQSVSMDPRFFQLNRERENPKKSKVFFLGLISLNRSSQSSYLKEIQPFIHGACSELVRKSKSQKTKICRREKFEQNSN